MPADVNSPLLQLLLQGTGNNNNSWGDSANSFVFTYLENAVAGMTSLAALTGGSYNLTDADARSAVLFLGGVQVSDQTIVCANRTKTWTIYNNTTGAFFMLFKTASGTAINIPRGKAIQVFCDGANGVYRSDRAQVGNLFFHGAVTAPPGALACNGALQKRASLVDLFATAGTTWGVGDGATTFGIPSGQDTGRYLRSSGPSAVGTSQANTVGPHAHPASLSGAVTDSQGSHTHSGSTGSQNAQHTHIFGITYTGFTAAFGAGGVIQSITAGGGSTTSITQTESGNHQHDLSGMGASGVHSHNVVGTVTVSNNTGTTETRPESLVGLLCIWY